MQSKPPRFLFPHRHPAISAATASQPEATKTVAEKVFEQAKLLPEPLAREPLDFVLFLRSRQERGELQDLIAAQSSALASVWDNPEDEAWNNV